MDKPSPGARAVSLQDIAHLKIIRENVASFMQRAARECSADPKRLLDIAPQVHAGAKPFFSPNISIDTFDIDPKAGCTFTGDLCKTNENIPAESYDYMVCTEVLEHTLQPFDAVNEMRRMLRTGGLLFLSVPFNFRIHGPLPDCWRFTEHGLRALFREWTIVELNEVETADRFLMPIHYTLIARK